MVAASQLPGHWSGRRRRGGFAKQFSGRTTAVCAGAVFAILPRVTWAGIEARSSALSVAAAVWLTVLLVAAVRCNTQRRWLLYALVLMLSILVSINLALLVPAYATMVPLLASGKSRKSPVIWWTVVTAAALGAMTPFILFAHGQVWQVGWIAGLNRNIILDVIHRQYFDHSVPFAILAGLIVAAGIAAHLAGARGPGGDTHRLVLVSAAWIVVPTAVVLIYSATVEPIYYPRYLILTAPAAAVILAVCVVTIARKPWLIAGVVFLLAAAAFRTTSSHSGAVRERGLGLQPGGRCHQRPCQARGLPAGGQHRGLATRAHPRPAGHPAGGVPVAD